MEVIGEDGYVYDMDEDDLEGDVLGYGGPMGDYEGDAEVEEYLEGDVGARRRRRRRRRHPRHAIARVRQPGWRRGQMAPGVQAPDQGMLILPMVGMEGQQFTSVLNQITFQGQVQKPFRGERLLVNVTRTGTTATGRLMALLFAGTDLQQLDVTTFDAELVGDPNAFGVRLAMKPVQPGVFMKLIVTLSVALTSPDTIDANVQLLGRGLH